MKTGEDFKVQLNRYVWKSRIILQNIWRVSDINVMNISPIILIPKCLYQEDFKKKLSGCFKHYQAQFKNLFLFEIGFISY